MGSGVELREDSMRRSPGDSHKSIDAFIEHDESKGPTKIPPLVELPRLLSAEHVAGDTDTDQDLRLLLAHGSSLGGARPKASVRDHDGHLTIAKFPSPRDEIKAVL